MSELGISPFKKMKPDVANSEPAEIDLEVIKKVFTNSLIVSKILSHLSTYDLLQCKWINNLFWQQSRQIIEKRRFFVSVCFDEQPVRSKQYVQLKWTDLRLQIQYPPGAALFHYSVKPDEDFKALYKNNFSDSRFPDNFQCLSIFTDVAVVGTRSDRKIQQVDFYQTKSTGLTCLMFPTHSSAYQVQVFHSEREFKHLFCNASLDQIKQIKCLLLYDKTDFSKPVVGQLLEKSEHGFAVGGVYCRDLTYGRLKDKRLSRNTCSFGGMVFSGQGINAASVVLHIRKLRDLISELTKFKQSIQFNVNDPNRELVGLMYSCVNRLGHFNDDEAEHMAFSSVFPNVKLNGMFGYGEFGVNFNGSSLADTQKCSVFEHSYTLVIVLLQLPAVNP